MIKYPRSKWAIPSEKLFKIDNDNLVMTDNSVSMYNSVFKFIEGTVGVAGVGVVGVGVVGGYQTYGIDLRSVTLSNEAIF